MICFFTGSKKRFYMQILRMLFKPLFLALVGVIAVLLVASCKASDPKDNNALAPSPSPSNNGSGSFVIRYRPQWYHQAQFAGVYMASKKGFYRNYGLEVDIQPGGPSFPAYESLESGKSDVVQMFLLTALARDASKNNLVNLAQISQKSALMLVGKRNRGLSSIRDLDNKSIGLWRTDFRELSLIFLEQHKLNMKVVDVDLTINLFMNDVIDMMNVMRYNEYHQILQAGLNPDELFIIPFSEAGLNILEDGIYTTREFYNKHPEECKKFAAATMDGWLYAINNQEETLTTVLDIMKRHHIKANRPHQAWMLKEFKDIVLAKPGVIGVLQEPDFDAALNLLKRQGIVTTGQEYRNFYPNEQ